MAFAVTLYLTIEADNEGDAREIVDKIETESRYQKNIFWNGLDIEVEEGSDP